MIPTQWTPALALLFAAVATPALAVDTAPTAMIETVTGPASKTLQPFDYLTNGQIVDLQDGNLTLSYMANCRRETIAGGRVTVGTTGSALAGGRLVTAQEPPCKAATPRLLADAREAGTGVKRHAAQAVEAPLSIILRTSAPGFTLPGPASQFRIWNMGGLQPLLVWEGQTGGSAISYPMGAQPLRSGVFYAVEAVLADGRTVRADFNIDPGIEAGYADTVQLR